MALKIVWSPRAAGNLEEICDFIGRDSERYAAVFAQRVIAVTESAADFPELGRMVPEYQDPAIRERILGNYRVVYRVLPGAVEIVLVTHGSRLLRS